MRRKRPRDADAAELAAHFDRERDAAYARAVETLTGKR